MDLRWAITTSSITCDCATIEKNPVPHLAQSTFFVGPDVTDEEATIIR
jgi:hypothetical protein